MRDDSIDRAPIRISPPGWRPMPARARPIPWPTAWRGCCWPTRSRERILCLTFTKAAAAEMQDRLFEQLGSWAMLPDDELREEIGAIGGDARRSGQGAAPVRPGAGNAGRAEGPDHPCLLPDRAVALSARGGRAAGLRRAGRPVGARPDRRSAPACAGTRRVAAMRELADAVALLVTRNQRRAADRTFWMRRWAMTGASWTASLPAWRRISRPQCGEPMALADGETSNDRHGFLRRAETRDRDICDDAARLAERRRQDRCSKRRTSLARLPGAGFSPTALPSLRRLPADQEGRAAQEAGDQEAGRCAARSA